MGAFRNPCFLCVLIALCIEVHFFLRPFLFFFITIHQVTWYRFSVCTRSVSAFLTIACSSLAQPSSAQLSSAAPCGAVVAVRCSAVRCCALPCRALLCCVLCAVSSLFRTHQASIMRNIIHTGYDPVTTLGRYYRYAPRGIFIIFEPQKCIPTRYLSQLRFSSAGQRRALRCLAVQCPTMRCCAVLCVLLRCAFCRICSSTTGIPCEVLIG